MKKTMDANERMLKILQASPDQQAAIDAILEGRKPDEQTIQGPLLMGVEEGAKFMGVSRTTLWRIIKSGDIKPIEYRPGSYKVRRQDLERVAGVRS